ncbi:DUF5325 family protein [Bacillus sp. FJAT-44742]|uniref:DUF5325 family protein n=1 Tax=Bacillus sp. FJAT-44742 TaxID=2014005 RepID=UPI000C2477B6|nr:DUF5325 family protein [Bacillus sp. FJAT-44742]
MTKSKWIFLSLAVLATVAIMGFGVAVAERSFLIALVSFVGLYFSFKYARVVRNSLEDDNSMEEEAAKKVE